MTDAAVISRLQTGSVTLHAFVAATDVDQVVLAAVLRRRLSAALPMSLRPKDLTVRDRLPTLPSGKTDLVGLRQRLGAADNAANSR